MGTVWLNGYTVMLTACAGTEVVPVLSPQPMRESAVPRKRSAIENQYFVQISWSLRGNRKKAEEISRRSESCTFEKPQGTGSSSLMEITNRYKQPRLEIFQMYLTRMEGARIRERSLNLFSGRNITSFITSKHESYNSYLNVKNSCSVQIVLLPINCVAAKRVD